LGDWVQEFCHFFYAQATARKFEAFGFNIEQSKPAFFFFKYFVTEVMGCDDIWDGNGIFLRLFSKIKHVNDDIWIG
jgi:hypothetical protein